MPGYTQTAEDQLLYNMFKSLLIKENWSDWNLYHHAKFSCKSSTKYPESSHRNWNLDGFYTIAQFSFKRM